MRQISEVLQADKLTLIQKNQKVLNELFLLALVCMYLGTIMYGIARATPVDKQNCDFGILHL